MVIAQRFSKTQLPTWLALVLILLIVLAGTYPAYARDGNDNPEIVATADEGPNNTWKVSGRIIQDSGAKAISADSKGAIVWVIAKSESGNNASFFAPDPNDAGAFEVLSIPRKIRDKRVVKLSVVARTPTGSRAVKPVLDEEALDWVGYLGVSAGMLIFVAGLFVPFSKLGSDRSRYILALVLACVFTGAMIVVLGMGLRRVNTPLQDDVTAVPFGSVYLGTFSSSNAKPEWLFSFTSPSPERQSSPATESEGKGQPAAGKGFGAPIWVLLMSVMGAGILTVSLIVGEIGSPPGDDPGEVRLRIRKVVRHQFFILFAPLGAIFVYQLLVVAQAAGNDVTVAIAALGSGIALNSLLSAAIRRATSVIEGSRRPSGDLAGGSQARHPREHAAVAGGGHGDMRDGSPAA